MSPDRRLTPNVKIDLSNWTIAWVKPGYTREVINTRTYNKGNNLLSQYNQYMNIWPCYRYNIHYKLEIKHYIHFFSFLYIVICLCNLKNNVNNSLHIMHLKGIYCFRLLLHFSNNMCRFVFQLHRNRTKARRWRRLSVWCCYWWHCWTVKTKLVYWCFTLKPNF